MPELEDLNLKGWIVRNNGTVQNDENCLEFHAEAFEHGDCKAQMMSWIAKLDAMID
jgi:hypothetical protein